MELEATRKALNFGSAFEDGDAFYAALVDAIDAAGDDRAPQFLARLVLILANQIGHEDLLEAAIEAATEGMDNVSASGRG